MLFEHFCALGTHLCEKDNCCSYYDADIENAWALGYTGKGVVVAVVDNGVDFKHPALLNNVVNIPRFLKTLVYSFGLLHCVSLTTRPLKQLSSCKTILYQTSKIYTIQYWKKKRQNTSNPRDLYLK